MPHSPTAPTTTRTWLVSRAGTMPVVEHELPEGTTRVGRGPQNDLVIQGLDVASVSLQHLEIDREGNSFRIRDLGSTNGTFVNGERITEAELSPPSTVQFGS